jgi:hypothetical protein
MSWRRHVPREEYMHQTVRQRRYRVYSDKGSARDWGSAIVVALVMSIAVGIGAIAITVYDSSVVPRHSITTISELPFTPQDGRAR